MTINAPAACCLLLYELVGEEQGVPAQQLRGTTQNDILKEYIARGNYITRRGRDAADDRPVRLLRKHMPSGTRSRSAATTSVRRARSAVQEVAFTLADGIAYVQAAIDAGLEVDEFAPRLAFFFNGHNNVFQEIAKFRAARRMWAQIMRDGSAPRTSAPDGCASTPRRAASR